MKKYIKIIVSYLTAINELPKIIIKSVLQLSCGMLFTALVMLIIGLYDNGTGHFAFFISRYLSQFALIILSIGAVCSYFFKVTLEKADLE